MFLNWHNIAISVMLDILQWTGALQFCRRLLWNFCCFLYSSSSPMLAGEPSPSPPQTITTGRPPPPLFALVIGIDKYLSNGVIDLSGAVADANAVNTFLQKSLRVPKGQIKILRNEEATRVTIETETEIKDLGNNPAIKEGDPILIYYAGHGAEANAPSGWSSVNGKIQMLVPYDFIPDGSTDSQQGQGVLDMKLSHLLAYGTRCVLPLFRKRDSRALRTVVAQCNFQGATIHDDIHSH